MSKSQWLPVLALGWVLAGVVTLAGPAAAHVAAARASADGDLRRHPTPIHHAYWRRHDPSDYYEEFPNYSYGKSTEKDYFLGGHPGRASRIHHRRSRHD